MALGDTEGLELLNHVERRKVREPLMWCKSVLHKEARAYPSQRHFRDIKMLFGILLANTGATICFQKSSSLHFQLRLPNKMLESFKLATLARTAVWKCVQMSMQAIAVGFLFTLIQRWETLCAQPALSILQTDPTSPATAPPVLLHLTHATQAPVTPSPPRAHQLHSIVTSAFQVS